MPLLTNEGYVKRNAIIPEPDECADVPKKF